jgi:hypothetical protein
MARRSNAIPSIVRQLRRRAGMPKRNTRARAAPPADGQNSLFDGLIEEVVPVVVAVNVVVIAVVPLRVIEAGCMLHVAGSLAATGAMAQVRLIVPLNQPAGVTVIVEVFPVVAPEATVIIVPLIVKLAGTTVTGAVPVALR